MAEEVEANNKRQRSLSAELSCATRIITLLIRLWLNLCPADVSALKAALLSVVSDGTKQVDYVICSVVTIISITLLFCQKCSRF